jgi:hypothetical protein
MNRPKVKKAAFIFLIWILFMVAVAITNLPQAEAAGGSGFWNSQVGLGDTSQGSVAQQAGWDTTPQDPRQIVAWIIQVVLTFIGIILVVLILWAGYQWMTAGGNTEQVTKAKSQIQNAVIGLVIVLAAFAITHYVTKVVWGSVKGNPFGVF